jgi:glyoxylase-like metal-dependent hydrolase (beta-lactamase superfamily II)
VSSRREFLKVGMGVGAAAMLPTGLGVAEESARGDVDLGSLPAWEAGVLEIHHIDSGRGNSTFVLGPDGTTLLIDAGEAHSAVRTMSPARPNDRRRAGEWIARYVARQLARVGRDDLDLLLLTHLHGDHVGEVAASSPQSMKGAYRLTGAADVAEAMLVRELIDRGWPDYGYPATPKDPSANNYIQLAKSLAAKGTKVQRARAGSLRQLELRRDAARYPEFSGRVLSVNGEVWTGADEAAKALFPALEGLAASDVPNENMCCVSMCLRYGGFSYFSGGDLTCDTVYGRQAWRDIETPVARAAGPMSVAVVNHHGYFDAGGFEAVQALRPRVWILPSWHVSHPAMNVLANLFSTELYPGERSVFAVGMTEAALQTTERFSKGLSSSEGHVVVRVAPGGGEYRVYVVDARSESGAMTAQFGPFPSAG